MLFLNYVLIVQMVNDFVGKAENLFQNIPRMLSQQRRRAAILRRRCAHADGAGHRSDSAAERMNLLDDRASGENVRVVKSLPDVVDRAAWDASALELCQQNARIPSLKFALQLRN